MVRFHLKDRVILNIDGSEDDMITTIKKELKKNLRCLSNKNEEVEDPEKIEIFEENINEFADDYLN